MLVSLWGRLYSDGRREGPRRRMAPFIAASGRNIVSEKIKSLGDRSLLFQAKLATNR